MLKSSGCKFPQTLTNQGPVYDNQRRRKKPLRKHRGNKERPPNWIK